MLFGQEHVQKYRETGGEEGHDWQGTTVLILTTKGRRSGEERPTPLIYQPYGDANLVVASKGGADEPPAWFLNLQAEPEVDVQVKADRFRMEWIWTESMGNTMRSAVINDDWATIAMTVAKLGGKLNNVDVPVHNRLGTPWVGAYKQLKSA